MNIFIVHSGKNRKDAEKLKAELETMAQKDANVLLLENGGFFWKIEALKLIKMSQMVLFLVGDTSHESLNITWELKMAKKYNKYIMFYKLNASYKLNDILYDKDPFSGKKSLIASEAKAITDITKKISSYEHGEYNIFNGEIENLSKDELLEQYKIFLQTSETLVERRQNVNSFYISVNAAVIAVFSVVSSLVNDLPSLASIAALMFVIVGILDISWLKILESYGILNSSKMKVISIIEKQLPASLYDSEWTIMSDKLNSKKYISFTDSEKRVPKLFIMFYALLMLVAIGLMLLK